MPEKASPSTAFICIVAGLFTIAASNTANATECFPGPDFKPAPGTRWQYRIDSATNQGCWYIQDLDRFNYPLEDCKADTDYRALDKGVGEFHEVSLPALLIVRVHTA